MSEFLANKMSEWAIDYAIKAKQYRANYAATGKVFWLQFAKEQEKRIRHIANDILNAH